MNKSYVSGLAVAALAMTSAAMAADVPAPAYKAPPPVLAPVPWSWTGLYIGAHIGGGWGSKDWSLPFENEGPLSIPIAQTDVHGFLGGVQAGLNYQVNRWVFGVEGQFSWTDLTGTSPCTVPATTEAVGVISDGILLATGGWGCNSKVEWLATAAARFGWTIDHALLFVKGGGAWVRDQHEITCNLPFCVSDFLAISDPSTTFSGSRTRAGWMFGTGVEYLFAANWSAKIEYDFMDFGTARVDLACNHALTTLGLVATAEGGCYDPLHVDIKQRLHIVKVGINYHFNWGKAPIVAKY